MGYCKYSIELKEKIVEEYLTTKTSVRKLSVKYDINIWTIRDWVRIAADKMRADSVKGQSTNLIACDSSIIDVTERIKNTDAENNRISLRINGFDIEIKEKDLPSVLRGIQNA